MRQIILITDGCSNVGTSPVIAAAFAREEGITVNVIGVVDYGELGELGSQEIKEIAQAGGGMSRIVSSKQLSQTVQMMTRKTVMGTIEQAVGKELRQILGDTNISQLPPDKRAEVVHVIDEMTESADLRVAVLVDASASMKPKLTAVREALQDLVISLRSRMGKSEMAVFHFPSSVGTDSEIAMDSAWTSDLAKVDKMFYKINMKGTTPTGPALLKLVHYIASTSDHMDRSERHEQPFADEGKGGILGDYVV
ncbi:VWA domain-containing protein [Paenibacillus albiflavus]|uniref:VWA domain-containing protein n=1 Tax=Paenibacillus albiflavus TaxID=2545760 RepID=A0A4R4E645_9BACL|nr:vWA domain-containing protein [Paenibacillus albiflavus]TCZ74353.1 VWA domain-containing protein [Paenibacillus albiflavus]